jgi:hypothetical protein
MGFQLPGIDTVRVDIPEPCDQDSRPPTQCVYQVLYYLMNPKTMLLQHKIQNSEYRNTNSIDIVTLDQKKLLSLNQKQMLSIRIAWHSS